MIAAQDDEEIYVGDLVAIADGSIFQGERGHVVSIEGDAIEVKIVGTPFTYTVEWWKNVQLLERGGTHAGT